MQGKPVTDFSLPSTGGTDFRLCAHRGAKLVLYFHPKEKMRFPFERLAHPEAVCRPFGVVKQKNDVKVPGHAQEVLNFAKAL